MSNILKDDEVAAETARQEQSAWDIANSTATEESYQGYLKIYLNGSHATQAQACIAKLKKEAAQAKSWEESVEWIKSQSGVRCDTNYREQQLQWPSSTGRRSACCSAHRSRRVHHPRPAIAFNAAGGWRRCRNPVSQRSRYSHR